MGKKKSVVLLTLITIVIVALCAMIAVPSFDLPFPVNGAESTWHPVVDTYDFDEDLGGGYYTYYYPEGVISEAEYKTECESREGDADRLEEYTSSYTAHGGIYLSTDPDDGVVEEDGNGGYTVTESFRTSFEAAAKEIADRYAKKGYSSYRVSVVDDYAIRVSVPAYDTSAGTTFQYFSYTGGFTLNDGTSDVFEEGRNVSASDYFRDFTPESTRDGVYVRIRLTDEGRTLIRDITTTLSSSSDDSSSSSGTLYFRVGGEDIISLSVTSVIDGDEMYIGGGDSSYTYETAQTVAILLESAVQAGDMGISFTADDARIAPPAYGENTRTLLYIALAIVLLAALVLPFVFFRGFGGACLYSTLSYFIITTLCFAFITSGVLEFTLGSVLIFLFGLLVTLFFNGSVYRAIKAEFMTGKTVDSSVKGGYKKSLAGTLDTYAVLILAALALLIGAAGLHALAIQALICLVTGAFCNLLWTRFISCMLLSASKDKYKYFGFVREDDDDE